MITPFKIIFNIVICCFLAICIPHNTSANIFSDGWDKVKHAGETLAEATKSAIDEVAKESGKGITDIKKLSKNAMKYVESQWDEMEKPLLGKLESTKTSTIKVNTSINDRQIRSENTSITLNAVNNANIIATGGFKVGIKVGYKKFSHTFDVTIGHTNNQINYNCIILQSNNYQNRQIIMDSTIYSGDHHFYGSNVNISTIKN